MAFLGIYGVHPDAAASFCMPGDAQSNVAAITSDGCLASSAAKYIHCKHLHGYHVPRSFKHRRFHRLVLQPAAYKDLMTRTLERAESFGFHYL